MTLTAIKVEKAKAESRPVKLSDAAGMYLLVRPNGAKYWRLAYRYNGKQKLLEIGRASCRERVCVPV